mmetsp:Transcript_8277/g.14930  ORF Transcript_8277/g.14930 Transcript_8277/m.14930 type:complete len:481 (-) Transcript_8277:439-1881(-)
MNDRKELEAFRVSQHSLPLAQQQRMFQNRTGVNGASAGARPTALAAPTPDVDRVILHFDVDAFYAQTEEVRDPGLRERPLGITQKYLVVTSNYPARRCGVTKLMAISEARRKCPDLVLIPGEDLTPFRQASKRIQAVLERFGTVERLGMDECYVDLTEEVGRRLAAAGDCAPKVWIGHIYEPHGAALQQDNPYRPQDLRAAVSAASVIEQQAELADFQARAWWERLVVGSHVAAEARAAVKRETGFRCSAGIACNKMMAKLVSGLHKPDDQTLLLPPHAAQFVATLPVRAIPGIGHKTNATLKSKFAVEGVQQLRALVLDQVVREFGEATGRWVAGAAWGVDPTVVAAKGPPKSITVEDSFKECSSFKGVEQVLRVLAPDLVARLEEDAAEHSRAARTLVVKWRQRGRGWARSSASCLMPSAVYSSHNSPAEKATSSPFPTLFFLCPSHASPLIHWGVSTHYGRYYKCICLSGRENAEEK